MRLPPVRISTRVSSPALEALYGAQQPYVFAGFSVEPLSSVVVFANPAGPHWHYVGAGLGEPFGHELTFRLVALSVEDPGAAPAWPVRLLQEFARHAVRSRVPLDRGQYLHLPDALDPEHVMRSGALVLDPELGDGYLQIVGLHDEELPLMSEDGYERFLEALRAEDALLVSDPARRVLPDPRPR
jgi:hypothetical protein